MARVIDFHKHITNETADRKYYPWQQTWHVCMMWAYGGRKGTMKPPFLRDPQTLYPRQGLRIADPEGKWTVQDMDEAGVDASVALPVDYDFSWGSHSDIQIEEKHQHLSELQKKYPGRIFGFAGPDPRRPGAVDIFTRGIKEHGLRGLKLIPKTGYYPWQEEVYQLLDRALELGVPAAICTQPSGGGYNRMRFSDPIHVDDAIGDFPDLTIVMLHAGAPIRHFFENALWSACNNINAYLQLDFWLRGFDGSKMLPSFTMDEEAVIRLLARARDVVGAHKLLFGTDSHSGPSMHGRNLFGSATGFSYKELVDWLKKLPERAARYGITFSSEEVDWFLGENSARILGIGKDSAWDIPHKYGFKRRSPIAFRGAS
ncbi:MAG: amidohydrolase family protein [Chloroflexi bacterium]|nr:amidohydrolase family protein [Chloroflexota bacterium]